MDENMCFASNANNAWIFNGNNNGNLNYNNNRINAYSARVFRDFRLEERECYENALLPLSVIYRWYMVARRGKRRSLVQLRFEADYPKNLRILWSKLNGHEHYVPEPSRRFVLHYPTPREVIHPDYPDRIPQTIWCETIRPHVEKLLDQGSYSCRRGRGALAAVRQLQEYYWEESRGGRYPCVFIRLDQKSFFLHIDRHLVVQEFDKVIRQAWAENPDWRDWMLWMCRILYLSEPREHMIRECPVSDWELLPPHKVAANLPPGIGVDIGNLDAQLAGNFTSRLYLAVLRRLGYGRLVHYTDDTVLVLRLDRLEQFKAIAIPTLRREEDALGLELNEKKTYIQRADHGICTFGYFIKAVGADRMLTYPSKRVVNNMRYRLAFYVQNGGNVSFRYRHKEHLRDSLNSYFGMLRHCDAYRVRKRMATEILESGWNHVIEFTPDYTYCRIKERYTQRAYHTRQNRHLKQSIKRYIHEQTRESRGI
jgi:hypothetical protein